MALYNILLNATSKWSDKKALVCGSYSYTYFQLNDIVVNMGKQLQSNGMQKGSKVALVIDNPIDFIIGFMAVAYCEAIAIPIYSNTGKTKILNIIEKYDVNYLLMSHQLEMDSTDFNRYSIVFGDHSVDMYSNMKALDSNEVMKDINLILMSSGTTSLPKAIMLSYENVFSNVKAISHYLKLIAEDNILMIKNMNHASSVVGEMLVGLYNGCAIYMTTKLPTTGNILKMMEINDITVFFAVPTLLKGIIEDKRLAQYNLKKLRIINFYGAKMPQEDIVKLCKVFSKSNVIYSYGLTEASPRVTYIERNELLERPGSSGKTIENVQVQIMNSKGEILPPNVQGEITVTGPNVMVGYYRDLEMTKKIKRNSVLHTRDIGYLDEDGFLYVSGRNDNMLISAGKNIYPEEIEGVLTTIPGILEALVVGEKTENETVELIAYIVLIEGTILDIKSIYRNCKERMENYKIPKEVKIVDKFDKTVSGKIKRKQKFMSKD